MSAEDVRRGLPDAGHAIFDELTAGFALDALEPGEEELLLTHLPECMRCQDALISHQEVAAALAYALPAEPMRPLSPALAECVASEPRSLPRDPFPAPVASGGSVSASHRPSVPLQSSRPSRIGRPARRALVGAGALGIIAAVGLSGYDVHLRSAAPRASATGAQAALHAITERGATIAHLTSSTAANATAVVADGHTFLVASGLAATSSSSSYVVWNVDGSKPTALQRFASGRQAEPEVIDLGVAKNTMPRKYAVTLEQTSVNAQLPASPSGLYVMTEDGHTA